MVRPGGFAYRAKEKYQDMGVAERYDRSRFAGLLGWIKLERDRILATRALREAGEIRDLLDLPCGTGRFTPILRKRAQRIVSADISREMMEVARENHGTERVNFVQCSVEQLPFRDCSFDFTFTARFLLHLPPSLRSVALGELARVSKRWVFFDTLMEGGLRGWWRRLLGSAERRGKARKRLGKGELQELLKGAGLRIHRLYRPSRLFSEKWMVLCEKADWPRGRG